MFNHISIFTIAAILTDPRTKKVNWFQEKEVVFLNKIKNNFRIERNEKIFTARREQLLEEYNTQDLANTAHKYFKLKKSESASVTEYHRLVECLSNDPDDFLLTVLSHYINILVRDPFIETEEDIRFKLDLIRELNSLGFGMKTVYTSLYEVAKEQGVYQEVKGFVSRYTR